MQISQQQVVRGALLLAIALIAQQLRLILPFPVLITTLIIGTLVNAALVLAIRHTGIFVATTMCFALPIIAFLQGHLPLPLLIPVVFLGNLVFILICYKWWSMPIFIIAPVVKTFVMYASSLLILMSFGINNTIVQGVLIGMGWPQLVTGV